MLKLRSDVVLSLGNLLFGQTYWWISRKSTDVILRINRKLSQHIAMSTKRAITQHNRFITLHRKEDA